MAQEPIQPYPKNAPGDFYVQDERGNHQYISLGNLSENPQAFLFLMDYAERRRIKVWGTARVVEEDAELIETLQAPSYPGKVERAIVFEVAA